MSQSNWPPLTHAAFDNLYPHQREEVAKALFGRMGLLTGSPGTGKTVCVSAIARAVIDMHGPNSLAIFAPTGKAASRAKLALYNNGVEFDVKTIHRTLKVESADGGWSFQHGRTNHLPHRFLIGDEWSMVGTSLDCSVMEARSRGTSFLRVGDCEQLAPVDCGAPFRDEIAVGMPRGNLTEIHRNAGTIVRVCAKIRDRQPFEFDEIIDLKSEPPKNLMLVQASRGTAQQKLMHTVQMIRDSSPFDAIWDLQVCCAVNKKSSLSRVELNNVLREELNPGEPSVKGSTFRVGDKVKCCKNSFFLLPGKNDRKELVANGEFGKVLEVETKRVIVQFFAPDRTVLVPCSAERESNGDDKESGNGSDLQLAFAATVHSMQGSSAPLIIGTLDEYPGATGQYGVCDRSWLFTLISRAEKAGFLVGQKLTAMAMCARQFIHRRKTFMVEDIRTMAAKAGVALKTNEKDLW